MRKQNKTVLILNLVGSVFICLIQTFEHFKNDHQSNTTNITKNILIPILFKSIFIYLVIFYSFY